MIRSGAIAGGVSVFIFTVIHQILISNIWFSFPIMLMAGGVCGLCLGWSYALVVVSYSISSWLKYTGLYVAMMVIYLAFVAAFIALERKHFT